MVTFQSLFGIILSQNPHKWICLRSHMIKPRNIMPKLDTYFNHADLLLLLNLKFSIKSPKRLWCQINTWCARWCYKICPRRPQDMPNIWENLKNIHRSITDSPTWIQEVLTHLKIGRQWEILIFFEKWEQNKFLPVWSKNISK